MLEKWIGMQTWIVTALVSIAIGAVGQLLLKLAARSAGPMSLAGPGALGFLVRLAHNPYLIASVVCFVTSMALWIKVLTTAELISSYPLVSLGYVMVAILSWTVLGERLGPRQMFSMAIIIFGVALLGRNS